LSEEIKDTAVRAMDCLKIEAGSMDIIENKTGYYIIDVNSVSNASEDNTEMFGFDLMKETAAYAVKRHNRL
jgi:ribosomal protein S6--L-glutamate ligase